MYRLVRKNNLFNIVENGIEKGPDEIFKSLFSPKWFGKIWIDLSQKEKQTWVEFLKTGQINDPRFNKEIEQSWYRSRKAEVDPFSGTPDNPILTRKLTPESEKLIELARPIMDTLYHFVRGSGFIIVLIDQDGYLLKTVGGSKELKVADDKLRFVPGANWKEEAVGTNAIGTALQLGHPVQVTGSEHFCENHHLWTCSASPIRKQNGDIIGYLDISGPRERATALQLGLIVAAAHAIEERYVLNASYNQLYDTNKYLEAVLNSVSDGIIAVNAQGIITGINKVAAKIFQLHPHKLVGQNIQASIFHNGRLQDFFKTRSGNSPSEEVRINLPGQNSCIAKANPVFSDQNDNQGFVLTFSPQNRSPASCKNTKNREKLFRFGDIIGESEAIGQAIEKAKMIAPGPSNVLILGESGTGKELFAQAIHSAGNCNNGPFVPVNCGAIPKELIQSELFGYAEGAFTGAKRGGSVGKFEAANGGTLFLDEIGEMPLTMQVNLLRVLEERTIVPVGGKKRVPLNARIVAATNKSLFEEVTKGRFREDLYYRLSVITFTLPSLKSREGDIPLLALYWVEKISRRLGLRVKQISPDAIKQLEDHHWPGNVRELVNALEYAVNFATGDTLLLEHLPAYLRKEAIGKSKCIKNKIPDSTQILTLRELEKEAIERALCTYDGNITKTAKALGIGRNTLYDKMKKYGIGQ